MLEDVVSLYGIVALTHLFGQINLSHAYYVKSSRRKLVRHYQPRAAIIIPSYNEDYNELKPCVISCLRQKYNNFSVVLIDDGSKDASAVQRIAEEFKNHPRFKALLLPSNVGKRHVQKEGFDVIDHENEIIVTIDSDTILAHDALINLVQYFQDEKVGAVTGNVRAIKKKQILTKLIDGRYWTAFNQERAAQSMFGTVLCCSGPLAAYRSSIIKEVKDRYISQFFMGTKCTFGDDRHLTNLVLEKGYKVMYEPNAHAITHVPIKLKTFLVQQTRWNKSFYRELLYTIKLVAKKPRALHPYIIYDLAVQTLLPLMLTISLIYAITNSLLNSPMHLLAYVVILVGISLLRTFYGFVRTKDHSLLLFPIYAFVHIFLLVPVRIYSLFTINRNHWGTR